MRFKQPQQDKLVGRGPYRVPLHIIVGVDEEGGFGKDGKIPWYFSEDLKHFKETTKNSICIMGRKTHEDMLEMVKDRQKQKRKVKTILPNRHSIVLTRNEKYNAEGAEVASSLTNAISNIKEDDGRTIFVIGGERIYIQALPFVSTIHMTIVEGTYNCDKFFPLKYLIDNFKITDGEVSEDKKLKFLTYQRTRK